MNTKVGNEQGCRLVVFDSWFDQILKIRHSFFTILPVAPLALMSVHERFVSTALFLRFNLLVPVSCLPASLSLVIRVVDFSESSLIVTLFTRDFGKIGRPRQRGQTVQGPFESALDLLALCRVVFLRKSSDALDLLTEAKLERRFRASQRDLARLYAGYYIAELLNELTDQADPHPDLFDLADDDTASPRRGVRCRRDRVAIRVGGVEIAGTFAVVGCLRSMRGQCFRGNSDVVWFGGRRCAMCAMSAWSAECRQFVGGSPAGVGAVCSRGRDSRVGVGSRRSAG